MLKFITGNQGKLDEAKSILGNSVVQLDLDLIEIQELDAEKVIRAKLEEARKLDDGEFFCEDTSLYIDSMKGFPGPLIKWYLKSLGNDGIYKQVSVFENQNAVAKTVIGYSNGDDIRFFEGVLKGEIVSPVGENGFGWDKIFKPNGSSKTLAQMSVDEKNKISMRKDAFNKLKDYLELS